FFPDAETPVGKKVLRSAYLKANFIEGDASVTSNPKTTINVNSAAGKDQLVKHRSTTENFQVSRLYEFLDRITPSSTTFTGNYTLTGDPFNVAGCGNLTYEYIPVPNPPTNLTQYKSDETTLISSGSWTNESGVNLKFNISGKFSGDVLYPVVEVKPRTVPFNGMDLSTGSAFNYTGTAISVKVSISTGQGEYHWRASVFGDGGRSVWANYGVLGDRHFGVDLTTPSAPSDIGRSPISNFATNYWTVIFDWDDVSDAGGSGTKGYNLQISTSISFIPVLWSSSTVISQATRTFSQEATYYWRLRTEDIAGNISDWSTIWQIVIDTTPPPVPGLVSRSPSDGYATNQMTLTFDWNDVSDLLSGTSHYVIQFSSSSDFAMELYSSSPTISEAVITSNQGDYWWRINAKDIAGNYSAWSTSWTVKVDITPPPVPSLISPLADFPTNYATIKFDWSAVVDPEPGASGIKQYELRISTDTNFSLINHATTTAATSAYITLLFQSTYYWQVRSYDNVLNTSNWSTVYYLQFDTTPPQALRNTAPDTGPPPHFRSQGPVSGDVDFYELGAASGTSRLNELKYRCSSKPDGTGIELIPWTLIVSSPVNSNSFTDNWSIPWDSLQEWATNYIHIYYSDRAGNYGIWNACFDILKDTTPPTVPVLVSPIDGYTTNQTVISFDWNDSSDLRSGVTSYVLHISTDINFAVLSYEATSYMSDTQLSGLATNLYYWRVCAVDKSTPSNFSLWSSTRSFRIDTIPPTHIIDSSLIDGDTTWRRINDGIYNVDFHDTGGANLDKFQIKVCTAPAEESLLLNWTDSGINIYGLSSFTTDWQLSNTIWSALQSGGTNYISIRTFDLAGNVSTYIDTFFVKKDTIPPSTPTLTSPADNTTTNQMNITFQWSDSGDLPLAGSGIAGYEFYLSTASDFSVFTSSKFITSQSFSLSAAQGSYFWRVRSKDIASNYSIYSTAYKLLIDTTPPQVFDYQVGDDVWQNTGGKLYDVDFYDTGAAQSKLDTIQYAVSTAPSMGATPIILWTDIVTPPLNSESYTSDWSVSFSPLLEEVTNYVSVRATDLAGNTTIYYDVFYIKKDVTNPSIIDNQLGDDTWRKEEKPDGYDVDFQDVGGSLLNYAQYRAVKYLPDGTTSFITSWIDIFTGLNQQTYTAEWSVDFSTLTEGMNNIWVQVFDNAGNPQNIQTYPDPFYVKKDTTSPTCIDNQSGEDIWRTTNNGVYDIDFKDATSGSGVKEFQVVASTVSGVNPDLPGSPILINWTTVLSTNTYSYTENWSLPETVWNALISGQQKNYISCRAIDFAYNTSTVLTDAFYVMKDTIPPVVDDQQPGDDVWRRFGGALYNVDFYDYESLLRGAQYIARDGPNQTDTPWPLGWVSIFTSSGTTNFTTDWSVDFANLSEGTNYIFVRSSDGTGQWTEPSVPVFYVKKDVTAPTITDNQDGDFTWRSTSGTLYGVFFHDAISGVTTAQYQIKDPEGLVVVDWTTIFGGTTPYNNYVSSWSISASAFNSLSEGTTNYVYVRCNDAAGNLLTVSQSVFFILKDTNTPYIVVNNDYYEGPNPTDFDDIDIDFFDRPTPNRQPGASKLNYAQYTIYTSTGLTGTMRKDWSDIAGFASGATYYITNWAIDFGALPTGATCYVSVRVSDLANNVSTYIDAFRVQRTTPTAPIISDNEPPGEDDVWYNSTGTFLARYYDIDMESGAGEPLSGLDVEIWTDVLRTGTKLLSWTTVVSTSGVYNYTEDWRLVPATFTAETYIWDNIREGENYVSVQAYDVAGRTSSVYDVFFVRKDTTPPAVPVLASPLNNSATNQLTVKFSWDPSDDLASGTSSYTLEISTSVDFSLINFSTTTTATSAYTTFSQETTYYWRVRAQDYASNYSPFSSYYSLKIDTTPPTTSNPDSPPTGTISNSLTQEFSWTTSSDAFSGIKNYILQLS
ncbi:MAG: hypothetical protein QME68_03850, partial [Elusimicrobiota bacterium]|nr:hypothetical protein [Elusimicrobiota bacterium]